MFNRIIGEISYKADQRVRILQGGLEWEIITSATSLSQLPPIGQTGEIFTFVYHREDQLGIYGFASESERTLFLELIKISGIGPRQACKILSGISDTMFIRALDNEDITALTQLPGLGTKTAQKIILNLRGKLSTETGEGEEYAEIIDALSNMGFDRGESKKTVLRLAGRAEMAALENDAFEQRLMKDAIVELSK